jgi:hypothetical protein
MAWKKNSRSMRTKPSRRSAATITVTIPFQMEKSLELIFVIAWKRSSKSSSTPVMEKNLQNKNKNKRSIPMWVRGRCAAAATVMVLLLLLLRDIFFLLRRFLDSRSFLRVAVV